MDWNSLQEEQQNIMINKRDYLDVMRAWSAYSACDVFNKNVLSIQDLRILLWIYEEEEPNAFKLIAEMQNIDADQSK